MTGSDVVEDVAALLATGRHDAQDTLDETASLGTVGSAADLTPQDRVTQCSLGVIVCRADPFSPHEGPQPSFVLEQLAARRRGFGTTAARPTFQRFPKRVFLRSFFRAC